MQRRCVMNLRPEHAVDHHLFIRVGACSMGAHGWMDWRLKPNFAYSLQYRMNMSSVAVKVDLAHYHPVARDSDSRKYRSQKLTS